MSYIMECLREKSDRGHFYTDSFPVWNRDRETLFDEGFTLKLVKRDPFFFFEKGVKTRIKGKSTYTVSWKDCTVPNLPDNWVLDRVLAEYAHSDSPLKAGQILWLRAMDFQRAKARAEAKDKAEAETKAAK